MQYQPGDEIMYRHHANGAAFPCVVRLCDERLLRLKVVFENGRERWVDIEKCFKEKR